MQREVKVGERDSRKKGRKTKGGEEMQTRNRSIHSFPLPFLHTLHQSVRDRSSEQEAMPVKEGLERKGEEEEEEEEEGNSCQI